MRTVVATFIIYAHRLSTSCRPPDRHPIPGGRTFHEVRKPRELRKDFPTQHNEGKATEARDRIKRPGLCFSREGRSQDIFPLAFHV